MDPKKVFQSVAVLMLITVGFCIWAIISVVLVFIDGMAGAVHYVRLGTWIAMTFVFYMNFKLFMEKAKKYD